MEHVSRMLNDLREVKHHERTKQPFLDRCRYPLAIEPGQTMRNSHCQDHLQAAWPAPQVLTVSSFHASSLGQELTGNAIEIGIENLRLQHVGVPHTNHHE